MSLYGTLHRLPLGRQERNPCLLEGVCFLKKQAIPFYQDGCPHNSKEQEGISPPALLSIHCKPGGYPPRTPLARPQSGPRIYLFLFPVLLPNRLNYTLLPILLVSIMRTTLNNLYHIIFYTINDTICIVYSPAPIGCQIAA